MVVFAFLKAAAVLVSAPGRTEPFFGSAISNFGVEELLRTGRVNDASYNATQSLLGVTGIVDLLGFVGQYNSIALILNAFEIGVPEGSTDPFSNT